MWKLTKLTGENVKYLIPDQELYIVGRKNCDIVLENDSSISRKHCTIHIAKKNNCPHNVTTSTGIWIVDEKSKYGTFLRSNNEWIKVDAKQNKKITDGSIIKFGLMENIWRFEYRPVVVCTSGIGVEQKKEIESTLSPVGGEIHNSLTKDCSLVVVNGITLTIKVVLALIKGIPIVTPQYLTVLSTCIRNQKSFPDCKNFKPEIKESILDPSLVSLNIEESRKELFKGKIFVVPTKKQLENLNDVITSAGGKIVLLSNTESWEHFGDENVIMIQIPMSNITVSEKLSKAFKEITKFLKDKFGKRIVPESEIAQAVAYSSVEKYCNPYSNSFTIRKSISEKNLGSVIVEETPLESEQNFPEPCVVQSSLTQNDTNASELSQKSITGRKRNHSPEFSESSCSKKKATDTKNATNKKDVLPDISSQETEKSERKSNECGSKKKNPYKESFITNYFKTQTKPSTKPSSEDSRFWDDDFDNRSPVKRKLSTESSRDVESTSQKKAKYPDEAPQERSSDKPNVSETTKDSNKILTQRKTSSDNSSFTFKKVSSLEKVADFSGFVEKEKRDHTESDINELNNTIFSLTLISSSYLNEDGTLIDPPPVPVNVKKFKKKKVTPLEYSLPNERIEHFLEDSCWIEPHLERIQCD